HEDETLFAREHDRFLRALERAHDPTMRFVPFRTQNRQTPVHESLRPAAPAQADDGDLTKAVLGIARGSEGDAEIGADNGQAFLETAVYSRREADSDAPGAPGFRNTTDSDPALPQNREWARGIRSRIATSTAGD